MVEDHREARDAVAVLLESSGYRVLEAGNGADGLLLARQRKPDLILMDLEMPVMDGLTAVQMLRQDPETARIPLVVVSGETLHREQEGARALCDAYLSKPCRPELLLLEVRRLTEAPRDP